MSKPIVFEFGGRPRVLKFGTNAIVMLEDLMGRPIQEIMSLNMGMRELRAILWAGLRHEDRAITLEDIGDWIDDADMETITNKLFSAVGEATGGNGAGTETKKPAGRAPRGTGKKL